MAEKLGAEVGDAVHVAPWSGSTAALFLWPVLQAPLVHQQHFSILAPAVAGGAGRLWVLELSTDFMPFYLGLVLCSWPDLASMWGVQPPQLFFPFRSKFLPCLGAGPLAMAQGMHGYGEQVCLSAPAGQSDSSWAASQAGRQV